jgi:hypothetical protein
MHDRHHARPEHTSVGDPCVRCGHPATWHRLRLRPVRPKPSGKRQPKAWVGLDGEGVTIDGHHRYTLLCCAGPSFRASVGNGNRELTSQECLEFILSIPNRYRIAGFCLGYDWTLILRDLPDKTLYYLFHPELRHGENGPKPVFWKGYKLNLAGKAKVMIARKKPMGFSGGATAPPQVVWDVFGFFQGSFVSALKKWSIGTAEQIERIQAMKRRRREFDKLPFERIRAYCFEECELLAELMTELDEAHEAAGLKLRSWFGAGSTASVLLDKLGVKDSISDPPDAMILPIHQAFFGGRFEHSLIGPAEGPIYGYDISSAYPFALTKLPCLVHGRWSLTRQKERAKQAAIALVHYSYNKAVGKDSLRPWGALPFRRANGNIIFPLSSAGGWSWGVEYWPAERFSAKHGRPQVFREAWVYETDCACRPFADLAEYYETRLQWGKEARGIVLKLGMNSVYGKLAQSVGSHRYRSLIWAGMVTAHCRGQLLDLMAMHKNPRHILGVATDGLYTTECLKLPAVVGKPLGGWECTEYESLFFIQPGVYFQPVASVSQCSPQDLEKKTRSRGVPRIDVAEQQRRILDSWERGERTIAIEGLTRFWGVKTSIHRRLAKSGQFVYERSDSYGEWLEHPHVLQYAAEPKRCKLGRNNRLTPWVVGPDEGESTPYDRALPGDQSEAMKVIEQILAEQPEGNFEPIEDE